MNLAEEQLYTLRHMLGINTPNDRAPKPYRNYAAVPPGDAEFAELVHQGAVEKCRDADPDNGFDYDYLRCTEAGKIAAMQSHRKIRNTKARRRYVKYLEVSDCYELTFKEFLTAPYFKECRKLV